MKNIGKEFMEMTKYKHLDESQQSMGIEQPPLETPYAGQKPLILLPSWQGAAIEKSDIADVINGRRSVRKFSDTPLSMEELSFLLWCTQGVQKKVREAATFRTVPSAGARHAIDTYLLINNVTGLEKGLYRYLSLEHRLGFESDSPDMADRVVAACLGQAFVYSSAATFIWTADIQRMYWRYGERGYRYVHLDAGHLCQNLYLACEAIGCGACAIAAFDDDEMNSALGLDGEKRFAVYAAAAGKK